MEIAPQSQQPQKSVLVLPSGQFQIPLIKRLKAKHYKVIGCDQNKTCPARPYLDEFHPFGLTEKHEILDLCKKLDIDAILTDQTDSGVKVVAWLSQQMELKGIGTAMSKLFTDKHEMRKFLLANQFPTPRFFCGSNKDNLRLKAQDIGFPVIIKPADGQSSKGVTLVNCAQDFDSAFKAAASEVKDNQIIVEEYIGGIDLSVEGFMSKTQHHTLAIAIKHQYSDAPTVIQSLHYTDAHPDICFDTLKAEHDRLIQSTNLSRSMTHAEYKYFKGRFYLIEFAARGGGSGIASDIVPWVSGVDYLSLMIDCHLHEPEDHRVIKSPRGVALLEFLDLPKGRVTSIQGLSEARSIDGVVTLELNIAEGDTIQTISNGTQRPGRYIIIAQNEEELQARKAMLLSTLNIEICE